MEQRSPVGVVAFRSGSSTVRVKTDNFISGEDLIAIDSGGLWGVEKPPV
jgi:hypothetical protein